MTPKNYLLKLQTALDNRDLTVFYKYLSEYLDSYFNIKKIVKKLKITELELKEGFENQDIYFENLLSLLKEMNLTLTITAKYVDELTKHFK